jgi:hypothetical protein
MTLPDERRRAITTAGEFLWALLDPKQTPRVPRSIRRRAARVLRHFPTGELFDLYYKEVTSVTPNRNPLLK